MRILKYAVGVDVSMSDFNACISSIDEAQQVKVQSSSKFANTAKGFGEFVLWAKKHHKDSHVPLWFLMEATGMYHENLAWHLFCGSFNVSIILPTKAKRYLQSIGNNSKNDKMDAQGLARMCAEKSLAAWRPLSKNIYVLRSLTRMHEDLQVQVTSFKNRLHAVEYAMYDLEQVRKANKNIIQLLEKQRMGVERQIAKIVENDPELKLKYQYVSSIKGVGMMTFAVLVAETNGFALIQNVRQLTSYAGYDVVENQSGTRFGRTRMSKRGNHHIRRVLHLPAFSVVKYEPVFKTFYERVYGNNGIKMKSYVAVQRKLLCLVYTLWRKEEMFVKSVRQVELSEVDG